MLAVQAAPLSTKDENPKGELSMESFTIDTQEFPDFSDTNLLESIDFDDLFVGINDGDVLPDLEMDPELLAEFSLSSSGEESEINNSSIISMEKFKEMLKKEDNEKLSGSGSGSGLVSSSSNKDEEIMSKREKTSSKESNKGRKTSAQSKSNNNNQGKRKVKVDWTPELHRRFVQAVEQLGVDKAVPSRILELMGIDCLTRHNIASHLQKYRSHRKHLLAREAEAVSWSQRRQVYHGGAAAAGGGVKREMNPWIAPTIGFPPPMTPMHHHHHHQFRPLHVWGHPTPPMDQSIMHMWPKHSPSPPSSWAQPRPPLPPPIDPSYWRHQRVPNGLTPGTPCFPSPQPLAMRFPAPVPLPGIPPHQSMYKVDSGNTGPTTIQPAPHPVVDFHPSKESIDAAIGDVISKPWLPLPLGLKPPSIDGVLGELQRQGVPKIPPGTCTAA